MSNSNHGNGCSGGGGVNGRFAMMQVNCVTNKDLCNINLYRTASSDNLLFLPFELPARPLLDVSILGGGGIQRVVEVWRVAMEEGEQENSLHQGEFFMRSCRSQFLLPIISLKSLWKKHHN